jgi:hypothetical protein
MYCHHTLKVQSTLRAGLVRCAHLDPRRFAVDADKREEFRADFAEQFGKSIQFLMGRKKLIVAAYASTTNRLNRRGLMAT